MKEFAMYMHLPCVTLRATGMGNLQLLWDSTCLHAGKVWGLVPVLKFT